MAGHTIHHITVGVDRFYKFFLFQGFNLLPFVESEIETRFIRNTPERGEISHWVEKFF